MRCAIGYGGGDTPEAPEAANGFAAASLQWNLRPNATAGADTGRRVGGIILGLWLTGVFGASVLARMYAIGGGSPLAALFCYGAAVVWPLGYLLWRNEVPWPRSIGVARTCAVVGYGLFGALSLVVSPAFLKSLLYYLLTQLCIYQAMLFNSRLSRRESDFGIALYAVTACAALTSFAVYDFRPGLRLGLGTNILNPNSIGLVCMSCLLASLAVRNAPLRWATMLGAASILVLTGSRASGIGTILGLSIVYGFRLRVGSASGRLLAAGVLLLGACLVWLLREDIGRVLDPFFAFSDRHRGLGTGFTGRLEAWAVTWRLFLDHPVLGIGFRAHEDALRHGSSHNGYLAMLAEIGIFGFACAMSLIAMGLSALWRAASAQGFGGSGGALLSLCIAYLFLGIFERYVINIGNPTSLLLLLAVVGPNRAEPAGQGPAV